MNKNDKGITLIALVITIIILLILAGITISLVIGDNGILNKAQDAGKEYTKAQVKEKIELAIQDIYMEEINEKRNLTMDTVVQKLPSKVQGITVEKSGEEATGTCDGYQYTITTEYEVIFEQITRIRASYVGTRGCTAEVVLATKQEANTYTYFLDGVQVNQTPTSEKQYNIENLQPETEYRIGVTITTQEGTQMQLNEIKIKTKPQSYVYDAGNEFVEFTGGFVPAYGSSNIAVEKASSYIKVTGINARPNHGFISTNNSIDLTEYRKVKVVLEHNGNNNGGYFGMFYISENKDSDYLDNLQGYFPMPNEPGIGKTEIILDVSNITGPKYIRIGAYASGKYMQVHRIILEK